MKKSKRNTTILIIITVVLFLTTILGATYAFFVIEKTIGSSINANLETASSMYSFTATSLDTIEMNIAFNEMSEANVSENYLKIDNAIIDVKLASPNNDTATICTYDIVWIWDGGDIYESPDGETLPIVNNDVIYNYEFSAKVDNKNETDLSGFAKNGNKVKLQEKVKIISDSTMATTKTHDIRAYIYNLPIEQSKLFGKNFKAHVTIDNLKCNMIDISNTKILATYIKEDVYAGTNPKGTAGLYYHDADLTSSNYLANGAADNIYRYSGADAEVNNYVCFLGDNCGDENNLYRIISLDSSNNQTKVIKATSIGNMAWDKKEDGSYASKWEESTLETYLNGEYQTSLEDKSDKIADTIWHVGGYTWGEHQSSNAKQIYDLEMKSKPTITKKIGLMYVHEYMYAALPKYWTLVGSSDDETKDYRASRGNDWLLSAYNAWTISHRSDNPSSVFSIRFNFGFIKGSTVNNMHAIRPSYALLSDIRIINAKDGVGTKINPMIIF